MLELRTFGTFGTLATVRAEPNLDCTALQEASILNMRSSCNHDGCILNIPPARDALTGRTGGTGGNWRHFGSGLLLKWFMWSMWSMPFGMGGAGTTGATGMVGICNLEDGISCNRYGLGRPVTFREFDGEFNRELGTANCGGPSL